MMIEKYSAGIVKRSTFFRETMEVGTLKSQGLSDSELKEELFEKNFLRITPERRNRETASAVMSRIQSLSDDEVRLLSKGTLDEKKGITLLSIMKTERIFMDFMSEVWVEKIHLGQTTLDEGDFNLFFRRKAEESEHVARWKPITINKIKQVMKKILNDLGFVRGKGKSVEILISLSSLQFIDAISDEPRIVKEIFGGDL